MFCSVLAQANLVETLMPEEMVKMDMSQHHTSHSDQHECCKTKVSDAIQTSEKCENPASCDMHHCNASITINHFNLKAPVNLDTTKLLPHLVIKPNFSSNSLLRPPKYQA